LLSEKVVEVKMKSFVRTLDVSDAVIFSKKEKLQRIIPLKDDEGVIVGYKESSPSPSPQPSPTIERRLRRQFECDNSDQEDDEAVELLENETPTSPHDLLAGKEKDVVYQTVKYLTVNVRTVQQRKRSQSELTPKMATTYICQPVSTVISDNEGEPVSEEFALKDRSNKYRTSLRRVKKISPLNVRKSVRKRTKSCVEESEGGGGPPPSPNPFKRKTSLFRGRNKDTNLNRTQSVPNPTTDSDNLCVPDEFLERKPSWSSLKEAINSTLKSPRLHRKTFSGDEPIGKRKSFEDIYGLKLEVAKTNCPEFSKVI